MILAMSAEVAPTEINERIIRSGLTERSPASSLATRDWLEPGRLARAACAREATLLSESADTGGEGELQVDQALFLGIEADRIEPPHVHVEREADRAKFRLEPVRLARSGGFGSSELQQIERLLAARADLR
jgi:hypothetical protein